MDYKIPEAGVVWAGGDTETRSYSEDMPGDGCHNFGRECKERSYTSSVVISATTEFIKVGTKSERSNISKVATEKCQRLFEKYLT